MKINLTSANPSFIVTATLTALYIASTCLTAVSAGGLSIILKARSTECLSLDESMDSDEPFDLFFVVMTDSEPAEVEDYYATFLNQFEAYSLPRLPAKMEDMPSSLMEKAKNYRAQATNVRISMTTNNRKYDFQHEMRFHYPIIEKTVMVTKAEICFSNYSSLTVKCMFDVNHVDTYARTDIVEKEHLDPIHDDLEKIEKIGKRILFDMKKAQRREHMTRKTADSTNVRVKYFTFFTVALLLGTTWFQIHYLKVFFTKKKLM